MLWIILFSTLLVLLSVFILKCNTKDAYLEPNASDQNTLLLISNAGDWQKLDKEIQDGQYGILHSVVVVQDSQQVFEKYYNNWQAHEIHDLQSATKSIASILIGIAIDKGYIQSVDQKLGDLLPDYQFAPEDSLKKNIRLRDLLTMTAGLEWKEASVKYRQPGNSLTDMYAQERNWMDYILERPLVDKPGTKFNYNSGISILLGAILQQNIHMPIQKFAEQYLFQPLGIGHYQWSEYFGIAHCGGGLYMTSQDLAKIGSLVLNGGRWNHQQVVPMK